MKLVRDELSVYCQCYHVHLGTRSSLNLVGWRTETVERCNELTAPIEIGRFSNGTCCDTSSFLIQVDPTVFHMLNEDPGGISFSEIGGLSEQIRELREVIELPLTNPELFIRVGIKPPKVSIRVTFNDPRCCESSPLAHIGRGSWRGVNCNCTFHLGSSREIDTQPGGDARAMAPS